MGVATGRGCKEVYRFPHTTYPYFSCSYLFFLQQYPYSLFILKMFFVILTIIESVDSISRDERDAPSLQTLE